MVGVQLLRRHARECRQCYTAHLPRLLAQFSQLAGSQPTDNVAFSFDIDGVLIRGAEVLAPARRALSRLYSKDGAQGLKALFMQLTLCRLA